MYSFYIIIYKTETKSLSLQCQEYPIDNMVFY